jgi:hypothetical protein
MKKKRGIISADIIGSTSLAPRSWSKLLKELKLLFSSWEGGIIDYVRIVNGDTIEISVIDPSLTLRVVLLLKTFIKGKSVKLIPKEDKNANLIFSYFKTYGVRIAFSIGYMDTIDKKNNILTGNPIFLTGRAIAAERTHNRKRVTIKKSIQFLSENQPVQDEINVYVNMVDFILNKTTSNYCNIIFYKLQNKSEVEIAKKLKITQSAVNQASTSSGWHVIAPVLWMFEQKVW